MEGSVCVGGGGVFGAGVRDYGCSVGKEGDRYDGADLSGVTTE